MDTDNKGLLVLSHSSSLILFDNFKHIPNGYHCITIDLPGHGETFGLSDDSYSIEKFVENLKLVREWLL